VEAVASLIQLLLFMFMFLFFFLFCLCYHHRMQETSQFCVTSLYSYKCTVVACLVGGNFRGKAHQLIYLMSFVLTVVLKKVLACDAIGRVHTVENSRCC